MAINSTTTIASLTKSQAKYTHPTYSTLMPRWQRLRDVRSGLGGFLNGSYLVAHPREWKDHDSENPKKPTKKLTARRNLACYENFAGTIVSSMQTALFREQAVRRLGDGSTEGADVTEWWENVDGTGMHIDDFMKAAWDLAGTFGHLFLYMDRQPNEATEYTAADQEFPFLRGYTPLDVWDWAFDDLGQLIAIKFAELAPRTDLLKPHQDRIYVRVVDQTSWTLYDDAGKPIDGGEHGFGVCPVAILFAERQPMDPAIGTAVLGDPMLYIDLYNITSEIRELLRNQTFGILNIPLGAGQDRITVEEAMQLAGGAKGSDNVLFSGLAASYIQPDAGNIEAYHAEATRRLRSIYRQASLSWESDSKDAEAEGSLKLKREDMNQRLSGYADECERTEYKLCELFYRAQYGADGWESRWETDDPQVKYPDTFDMTPFGELVDQAEAAASLGMPPLFLKEQRKMLVGKFTGMGDLPQQVQDEITKAIDEAPDDLTPAEQAEQRLDLTMKAMQLGKPKEPASPMRPAKGAAA